MKNEKKLLIFLILLFFVINYHFLDSFLIDVFDSREEVVINNVIDGDTVKVNGTSIRLLGINTPEKGEVYYEEAKEFLEGLVLNKTVYLEYGKEKHDKYNRILAYIFLNNENIHLKIVERGFANFYFPSGKDKYYFEFKEAWENCIKSNKNLCERSSHQCSGCISLNEFSYENKLIVLKNTCSFDCDLNNWKMKAEGRTILDLNITLDSGEEEKIDFDSVWTKTGNTLFVRDDEFKLVLWKSY